MTSVGKRTVLSGEAVPPELLVLLACGSPRSEWGSARLSELLGSPLNWPRLVELTDWNGMAPLLSQALRERAPRSAVPPDTLESIRSAAASKTLRALGMARELARLTTAMQAAGIPVLVFKGPTLAKLAYDNLGIRDSTDLDLLVPRENLSLALEVLSSLGYSAKTPAWDTGLAGSSEIALRRSEPDFEVDLHWLFTPRIFRSLDPERALSRSVPIEIAGAVMRTLCPEDLLRYLCIHAAFEGWAMARFVVDIAALLERCPIDWDDVTSESARDGTWRALAAGLSLARLLCGAALPAGVARRIEMDRSVERCTALALTALASQSPYLGGSVSGIRVHLGVLKGAGAKLNYLWRRAIQPNHLDVEWLQLPRNLNAGYYLVRPVRLMSLLFTRLNEK